MEAQGANPARDAGRRDGFPLDLTAAGALLLTAALVELLAHRLGWVVGLYAGLGASGPAHLMLLEGAGRLGVNAVAITAVVLTLPALARAVFDPRFGPWPARAAITGLAAGGLVVVSVSVFRALHPALVLGGYAFSVAAGVLTLVLAATRPLDGGRRRILISLALIQLLPAAELVARAFGIDGAQSDLAASFRWAYLLAEVLLVVVPTFAFFTLELGRLRSLLRRPPLLALGFALGALAVGVAVVVRTGDPGVLSIVADRALGITLAWQISGIVVLYLVSLFFGALLVGTLLFPGRSRAASASARRTGIGLVCLLAAGLQPSSPYLYSLSLFGALALATGLVDQAREERFAGAAPLDRGPTNAARPS